MKFKLPSFRNIQKDLIKTSKRFPLAVFFLFVTALFLIINVELGWEETKSRDLIEKICLISSLAVIVYLTLYFYLERIRTTGLKKILLFVTVSVLLLIYYFSMPDKFNQADAFRYILVFYAVVMMANISLVGMKNNSPEYSCLNIILIGRICTAFLFALIIYLGIWSAVFAVDSLFELGVDSKIYLDIWIVIAVIFAPLNFLAGFPRKGKIVTNFNYPQFLKILVTNILLPLTMVYLAILYLYFGKIVILRDWPKGLVTYLILSYSVLGIFVHILLKPLLKKGGNKWYRFFPKYLYIAIVPLIFMLFFAIWKRMVQYGITEKRYFVVLLAIWLAGISLYFIVSKEKNMKLIPLSLAIISLLAVFGPWSAFTISKKSQINRLYEILNKNNLLVSGKLVKSSAEISFEDRKNISSIFSYIQSFHDIKELRHLVSEEELVDEKFTKFTLVKEAGFEFVNRWTKLDYKNFNMYRSGELKMDVADYQSLFTIKARFYFNSNSKLSGNYKQNGISVDLDFKTGELKITKENNTLYYVDIVEVCRNIKENVIAVDKYSGLSQKEMTYMDENEDVRIQVVFNNICGENDKKIKKINSTEFYLLIGDKQ